MDKGWREKNAVVLHVHVFSAVVHICPLRQAISDYGSPRVPTLSLGREEESTRRRAAPSLPSKKQARHAGHEGKSDQMVEAQRQRPQPRPCEPVQPVSQSVGRPATFGMGGGQIRLGGLTGVGGDPTQAFSFWDGVGRRRADAQLRNCTCQPAGAIFCRSEPLTDGVIMGVLGSAGGSVPLLAPKSLPAH